MKKCQIIRRVKLRLPGGEITRPTHLTLAAQKNQLLEKIENGEIMIGELITPIHFTKLVADKSTKIISETTVTLHSWRILLLDIRTKLLKDQEQLGTGFRIHLRMRIFQMMKLIKLKHQKNLIRCHTHTNNKT